MRPRAVAARVLPVIIVLAGSLALVPAKTALNDFVGQDVGFVPALMVVILGAYMGFVPGLIATIAVVMVETTVFLAPRGALDAAHAADRLRLALLGTAGLLASWMAWLRSRAERQARAATIAANDARARGALILRRVEALQALAAELGGTVTSADIARALVAQASRALSADGVAVLLLEPGGDSLRVVGRSWDPTTDPMARSGDPTGDPAGRDEIPIDADAPPAIVARTGVGMFIENAADGPARDAASSAGSRDPSLPPAIAVVPMEAEGERYGVLTVAWNRPHELPADRRVFIGTIARLGAAALERARLLEAERRARQRAEDVQQHLDLLAEAGRALGLSLEYEETLRRLAGLAVPLLGDVGIADVIEADGVRRLVAARDTALEPAARIVEAHPLTEVEINELPLDGGARADAVDEAMIQATARSSDHAAALRTIAPHWMLRAPLRAQDRTIGVLTFLRRDERACEPDVVAVAGELGDRAGRALENARLHRQVARLASREQRRAAELEAVIGAIGEGILVVDPDGMVLASNEAARRLLGGVAGSLDDVLDRLVGSDGQRPGALPAGPLEYRLAAHTTAWVELARYDIAPGPGDLGAASSVIVCRDVTAFRQGQALREAFLGLLSHELRTPVTTIYGGSSVLTRPGGRIPHQTQADILEDIAGEADRLFRLVEDLMVLARFDEGIELGSDPILLQHLVPTVVEQEAVRWPALRVTCTVEPDLPMVGGDETSITQVVRNLVSNAAKYSEAGSSVEVMVERTPDGVAVRVLDEGPGVDPAEVEHLFDPFYRSPSTAKLAGGAGIGLYVSRRLVDAMSGQIRAAPRAGRGSEFTVVLPPYRVDGEDI